MSLYYEKYFYLIKMFIQSNKIIKIKVFYKNKI